MVSKALVAELRASVAEMSNLLIANRQRQDWQPEPGGWSLRYIAAHMRQTEIDAHWNRVMRIANNENPHYTYYLNTGWDFSRFDLMQSVDDWNKWRSWVIDWCVGLSAEKLTYTGTHDSFGTITIPRVLELAVEHDKEHIEQMKGWLDK